MDVVRTIILGGILLLLGLMSACNGVADTLVPTATDLPVVERITPSPMPSLLPATEFSPSPTPVSTPSLWDDANDVMNGLCYESVDDAAGKTFVIHNSEELVNFFDLADHSDLCRHPVRRGDFDFSGGRVLAGLWSKAVGCTAHHDVSDLLRDDDAKTYTIMLKLVVDGGCDYELVRPFWIGLSGVSDYDIRLVVVR